MNICWVITGAGHFLRETAAYLEGARGVDIYLTRAACEVCARYGVADMLASRPAEAGVLSRESDHSAGALIKFSMGRYDLLVIAPATSNTVAKCALGIADSLASTFFAQAGKSGVRTVVLPTDTEASLETVTPSGKTISITPRPIDLAHARALRSFPGVDVVSTVGELLGLIASLGEHGDVAKI